MGRRTHRHPADRHYDDAGVARVSRDVVTLAAEEPLEIRVGGQRFAVRLRTPGDDMDLAAGVLVAEGAAWHRDHLPEICYCTLVSGRDEQDFNTLTVTMSPDIPEPRPLTDTSATEACGLGRPDAIDTVLRSTHHPMADATAAGRLLSAATLRSLPRAMRESRKLAGKTGGAHAAGLFGPDGDGAAALCVREDTDSLNAVDKVLGWALREGRLPLSGRVLQISGRPSFEHVRRAAMAGIPVLCATGAPSSLAVDLAERCGVTLAAFADDDRVSIFTHHSRVAA